MLDPNTKLTSSYEVYLIHNNGDTSICGDRNNPCTMTFPSWVIADLNLKIGDKFILSVSRGYGMADLDSLNPVNEISARRY
jgi:hypothetical protein